MKRFFWSIILVVFAVALTGCAGDPVKEDIEAYIKVNQAVEAKFNDKMMRDFERRMSAIQTPEEVAPILEELKGLTQEVQGQIATLKPKSDEMKPLVGKINQGFLDMVRIFDEVIVAVKSGDEAQILAIEQKMTTELNQSLKEINSAEAAIVKLANEKGIKAYQK